MPQYFYVDKQGRQVLAEAKVERAFAITPDNDTDLEHPTIAIYVGETGDLSLELISGDIVLLKNIVAGAWHPISATKVLSTDTTCGEIVGAY